MKSSGLRFPPVKADAMNSARITYTPRPDATPESELDALACVYRFVLERHAARAAAAGSFRLSPEGGGNGPLTKETDEDVDSQPIEDP